MRTSKGINKQERCSLKSYVPRFLVLTACSLSLILLTSQVNRPESVSGKYFGQQSPGNTPKLFANGIIPEDLHSAPVFSADGRRVYFKPMDRDGIMVMKMVEDQWSLPMPLFVNDEVANSDDPCLSPDSEKLFFTAYNKTENREYIYFCDQKSNNACVPQLPAGKLNALDLHWQFSVTESGNIYFSSNGNIFYSESVHGIYGEPVKLDSAINTPYSECTPYVTPDERLMIFSRANGGKANLYISYKGDDGSWQKASMLGNEINSDQHELCPSISPDGKYLFFLSSRQGLFSAYWVETAGIIK